MPTKSQRHPGTGRSAFFVATGILASRLAGLVRLRVFSYYFGLESDAADAFNAAFRIPNFLQNLFGEGALSASLIPVYAPLVARGERREADRVAGAVASFLAVVVSALVLVGVLATPLLIDAIAPGFTGAKRLLTIEIVRILFPGAGLLVLSAWCLGVLNSHHKFLLSYTAPVMWNVAMIATLVYFGRRAALPVLATRLAWGSVAGSFLQFIVQVPFVLARGAGVALCARHGLRTRAHGRQKFRARLHQPRRRPDQRLRRRAARQPAADRRGDGARERAAALHAARQPVRHVGVGRGTARDVGRGERRSGRHRSRPAAPRRGPQADRVLRRPVGRRVRRARRRGGGGAPADRPLPPRRYRSTSGASSPARASACSPRRSAGCIRPPITRCATPARRSTTRSSASRSRPSSDTCLRFRCRAHWAFRRCGARPG